MVILFAVKIYLTSVYAFDPHSTFMMVAVAKDDDDQTIALFEWLKVYQIKYNSSCDLKTLCVLMKDA